MSDHKFAIGERVKVEDAYVDGSGKRKVITSIVTITQLPAPPNPLIYIVDKDWSRPLVPRRNVYFDHELIPLNANDLAKELAR